ncbi:MAG TPA: protein-glutamate O-methyltransferase CheR [Gemmatimonadales bacterium]|nr:protein-glutamate O-methyltransferase CheR [Gemmatimonadales bacterium]
MSRFEAAEWKLLTDLIQERFGLTFDGVRCEILEARLRPRMRDLHLPGLRDYYHYLRFHPERETELGRLMPLITNNETYFFREPHHFDVLVRHVIPERRDALRRRPLRLLSAGCSSGEEAYSIVIALQNAGLELAGIRWEIDACDLNPDRIAQAREGMYDAGSLRACDDESRRRYFKEAGGRFQLRERFRKGVRFFVANLSAPNGTFGWRTYDAILCRNMLIYFGEEAFDAVIGLFARSLCPGGYLLLGHSESLLDRATDFVPVSFGTGVVYRKGPAD